MKTFTAISSFILLLTATVFGGAFLEYFQGHSDGSNIIVEWKTKTESNLQSFEIQRKAGWNGEFVTIASIEPKGSNSYYTFVDRSAYKTTDNMYVYRLKISEGSSAPASYSNEVAVSHSVSSVKRTWGSIKAMFR